MGEYDNNLCPVNCLLTTCQIDTLSSYVVGILSDCFFPSFSVSECLIGGLLKEHVVKGCLLRRRVFLLPKVGHCLRPYSHSYFCHSVLCIEFTVLPRSQVTVHVNVSSFHKRALPLR